MEEKIIISPLHNNHFRRPPNLFHYRLPNCTLVSCWETHGWSECGWMAGLGMLRASRLSSIWAGRCAKEKTTTQRARSPSGDQFMALALSLPVKKKISWCVFKRLGKDQEEILFLFPHVRLLSLLLSSVFFSRRLLSCSSVFAVLQFARPKVQMCSLYLHACARMHIPFPALEHAKTHTPALTYIC